MLVLCIGYLLSFLILLSVDYIYALYTAQHTLFIDVRNNRLTHLREKRERKYERV